VENEPCSQTIDLDRSVFDKHTSIMFDAKGVAYLCRGGTVSLAHKV
jgi:hypothetical protein